MAAHTGPDWLDSLSEEWVSEAGSTGGSPVSEKSGESIQIIDKSTLEDELAQLQLDKEPKKTNDIVVEGESSSSVIAQERDTERDDTTVAASQQDENPSTMYVIQLLGPEPCLDWLTRQ